MSTCSLKLHFAKGASYELVGSEFCSPMQIKYLTTRGKACGTYRGWGTFQWTKAVRAICVLSLKAKLGSDNQLAPSLPMIAGNKGSLAASLDDAISKGPIWLTEMFGIMPTGHSCG